MFDKNRPHQLVIGDPKIRYVQNGIEYNAQYEPVNAPKLPEKTEIPIRDRIEAVINDYDDRTAKALVHELGIKTDLRSPAKIQDALLDALERL